MVTSSQTPSQVVPKAPGGKYFSVAEWGKGTALHGTNLPAPKGECTPCSFSSLPQRWALSWWEGEKGEPNSCSEAPAELWGNPLTLSSFPSSCALTSRGYCGHSKARDAPAASLRKICRSIELVQAQASKPHWNRVTNISQLTILLLKFMWFLPFDLWFPNQRMLRNSTQCYALALLL